MRVHYISYGKEYDEWKDKDEIQMINTEDPPPNNDDSTVLQSIAGKEIRL